MLPEIKLPHNTATKTTLGRVRTGEALAALVGASLEPPGSLQAVDKGEVGIRKLEGEEEVLTGGRVGDQCIDWYTL